MVMPAVSRRRLAAAFLTAELMVAIGLITAALLPISYSFQREARIMRAAYYRAVAMEIVDGEMEILSAGNWKFYPEGATDYKVHAASQTNLPPGQFRLSRAAKSLRLEWLPAKPAHTDQIMRQIELK
jgi:hypothetical protein